MRHAVRVLIVLLILVNVRPEATARELAVGADPAVLFVEDTVAAIGINLERAQPIALAAWMKSRLASADPAGLAPERAAEISRELDAIAERAEAQRAALLAAGATDLWLAFSWRGFPDRGLTAAIWTRPERDAGALAAWVRRSISGIGEATTEAPGLLIFGDAACLAGLPCADADRLAGARAALGAAGAQDLACTALVLPSAATRKAFAELAADARLPGSDARAEPLIRNVLAATLGLRLEPAPVMTLRVESADQKGSAEVSDVMNAWLAALAGSDQLRGMFPEIGEFAAMLRPTTDHGSSIVTLDEQELSRAAGALTPTLALARDSARSMAEASRLRAVAQSCVIFEQNANRWPEDMAEILKDGYMPEDMTRDARGRQVVYLRPEKDAMNRQPERTVIAHQAFDAWPEKGIWVAFVDGHVELVQSQEQFRSYRPFAE
jgi:hypothetical protein